MTIFQRLRATAFTLCAAGALAVTTAAGQMQSQQTQTTDPETGQQTQTQQTTGQEQQQQDTGMAERQMGAEQEQMPATASPIGILLLGGVASLAAGAALRRSRS